MTSNTKHNETLILSSYFSSQNFPFQHWGCTSKELASWDLDDRWCDQSSFTCRGLTDWTAFFRFTFKFSDFSKKDIRRPPNLMRLSLEQINEEKRFELYFHRVKCGHFLQTFCNICAKLNYKFEDNFVLKKLWRTAAVWSN